MLSISTKSLRMLRENLPRGFQAVHAGHGAIHDNHFRTKLVGEFDCFGAVARFAGNGNVRLILQNAAETPTHQGSDRQPAKLKSYAAWESSFCFSRDFQSNQRSSSLAPLPPSPGAGRKNSMRAAQQLRRVPASQPGQFPALRACASKPLP